MDIIKIKEFHDAKFTIKNMKRQPTEKKKIIADHIPGKELHPEHRKSYITQ